MTNAEKIDATGYLSGLDELVDIYNISPSYTTFAKCVKSMYSYDVVIAHYNLDLNECGRLAELSPVNFRNMPLAPEEWEKIFIDNLDYIINSNTINNAN